MVVQVHIQRKGLASWPSVESSEEGLILAQCAKTLVIASGLSDVEQDTDRLRFKTNRVAYVDIRSQNLQHGLWAQVRFRGNGSASWASAYLHDEVAEGRSLLFLDTSFEPGHINRELIYAASSLYTNNKATTKLRAIIQSHSSIPLFCSYASQTV